MRFDCGISRGSGALIDIGPSHRLSWLATRARPAALRSGFSIRSQRGWGTAGGLRGLVVRFLFRASLFDSCRYPIPVVRIVI